MGEGMQDEMKLYSYVECSSLKFQNVTAVFSEAVEGAMEWRKIKKPKPVGSQVKHTIRIKKTSTLQKKVIGKNCILFP